MNLVEKYKKLEKYEKIAIWVLIIAIVLRFSLASIYHVSGDACWQLSNAKFIAENQKIPLFEQFGRDEPFWPPPLFHIISAFVYAMFLNLGKGVADFAIKMISPILGSITLILFFQIAKQLFNKKIALLSLLFLAFIPLHIDYSVFSYVDGTITFLAVLSVYLALKNRLMWSAAVAGLTILTKYNGAFIVPVILYIAYMKNKDKKAFFKNFLTISIISGAIGGIWFIRNWLLLGNPVWPFFNSVIGGVEMGTFALSEVGELNFANLLSISGLLSVYLGIFGVPDGNIETLTFFNIPHLNILLIVWLLSTIIFSIPILFGLVSKKLNYKWLLYVWMGSFILLIMFYAINASWSVSRFLLPAFPAIALVWAYGIEKIRPKKMKRYFILLLTLIMIGFVFTSVAKIVMAANTWSFYEDDFGWVKKNTEKNALFMAGSHCISYNLERQTVPTKVDNLEKADYVWINQNFKLDRLAILDKNIVEITKKEGIEVYKNKKTGTEVYKIS